MIDHTTIKQGTLLQAKGGTFQKSSTWIGKKVESKIRKLGSLHPKEQSKGWGHHL